MILHLLLKNNKVRYIQEKELYFSFFYPSLNFYSADQSNVSDFKSCDFVDKFTTEKKNTTINHS